MKKISENAIRVALHVSNMIEDDVLEKKRTYFLFAFHNTPDPRVRKGGRTSVFSISSSDSLFL